MRHEKKRKLSDRIITILLVVVLLVGLSVLLYPGFSNWWNSRTMSRAVASYHETVGEMSEEEYQAILAAAQEYNARLYELGSSTALADPDRLSGYEDLLSVTGDGLMGYVTIERIGVELPIYHGTEANVLSAGAGHLEGSSLPIGGENTHSVISAHRGLPSAELFTHLDRMEEGDLFTVTVLNETCTYEVDQISTVLPTEYEDLYIEPGKDYCTLMTCTPYGINTHRLLVRGVRTDNVQPVRVDAEAYEVNSLLTALLIAVFLLAVPGIYTLVRTRKKRKNKRRNFK